MDCRKKQMETMHTMCQRELNQLHISMERYLQDSERVQKLLNGRSVALEDGIPLAGRRGINNIFALIAFDRYMTQISTVISMARKFNIHMQMNALDKTVLDTAEALDTQAIGINSAQSHVPQTRFLQDYIQWTNGDVRLDDENNISHSSRTLGGADGVPLERKAIEQSKHEDASDAELKTAKQKPKSSVNFIFSDLNAFLRSILPIKDLSHFTQGHTFSASITYFKDYINLVFFVCEMSDYRKLYEISNSTEMKPISESRLTQPVFGVSQDEEISINNKKCVWRAVKLPENLDEAANSVILIDFGEIIQLTENCQLYNISPRYQEYPPLAIKCVLEGVCDSNGTVTSDHGKCKEALLSNEFTIAKFRVISQESRVLHLVILPETEREEEPSMPELKMTRNANPFLDSLSLEEEAELEDHDAPPYLPISTVYGHTPRVGPNCNIRAKIGDCLQVTVTYVSSPISFYGTIAHNVEELSELFFWSEDELMPTQKTISPPKLNDILLAQYSKDEQWYRAQVIEIISREEMYKVFYIDFGNIETVTLKALASCKHDVLHKPSQAVPFRLADLKLVHVSDPLNKIWSSADTCDNINAQNIAKAIESVVVIILNQTITVEVTDRRGDELVVRFHDDLYAYIPSMLINMGVAAKN